MIYIRSYVVYHLHDDYSNPNGYYDSCTSYKEYIKMAKKHNMNAIAFSNHGNVFDWVLKKRECDKNNIKYIHGVEMYMCTELEHDERGFHIGMYAKNLEGVKELNSLVSIANLKGENEDNTDRHSYYNPRLSMSEVMNTSDNIIITTACLASFLHKSTKENYKIEYRDKFLKWLSKNSHRCFLEIQYHDTLDQIEYNKLLYKWSKEYNIPLIAGTDTHSLNEYKAKCRLILQQSQKKNHDTSDDLNYEDALDLTWKSYDDLVEMFKRQNSLHMDVIMEAIDNTNKLADLVENFSLDRSFKYPNLYGDNAEKQWWDLIQTKLNEKLNSGVISVKELDKYMANIEEEYEIMCKQGMGSFMIFMSELITWCHDNNIPTNFNRGSVGGSTVAYITDITDLNPVVWNTVFSRFCNADRISLGDIDIDFAPEDREKVYKYIINRFTPQKTAYIAQFGTIKTRGAIDVLARGLKYQNLDQVKAIKNEYEGLISQYSKIIQAEVNLEELEITEAKSIDFDYHDVYIDRIRSAKAIEEANKIKNEFDKLIKSNQDLFYYFDGIRGTIISKGNHPAGIIGSPVTIADNLGVFYRDGNKEVPICQCAMDGVEYCNFVKFDILGLKTLGILKDAYRYAGLHFLKSHEINWNDKRVWDDMIKSNVSVFQFEGDYAFSLLKEFKPQAINDMSLVNAALRPSGKSYRDRLIAKKINKNPSEEIDMLLKDNYGYLVYQEDTIKFLSDVCDLTGSEADTIRRAIGNKDREVINDYLPRIIDGYCNHSKKDRKIAEEEVKQFLQIIEDSSEYQFGLNHATGYSMLGYACVRMRCYYPIELATAYLNRADNEEDINMGTELANLLGFNVRPARFRYSTNEYMFDKSTNTIYKGVASIKNLNHEVSEQLYSLRSNKYNSFYDLMMDIKQNVNIRSDQLEILIKLDYFEEFGKSKKLLSYIPYFNGLYQAKLVNKGKFEESIEAIISKYSRETTSQYRDLDNSKILSEIWKILPEDDFGILEKITAQKEYLGYIDYSNPNLDKRYVLVTDLNTRYSPRFIGYCLNNGKTQELKVYRDAKRKRKDVVYFKDVPFEDGDLLFANKFNSKPKSRKTENGWVDIPDTKEWWLVDYRKVDNLL